MVVDRGHLEYASTGRSEDQNLDDHRQDLSHEQGSDDDHQQLGVRRDGQADHQAAERQGAGVAHEDLSRSGIPPEEAQARPTCRGSDDREIEGVTNVVATGGRLEDTRVPVLPTGDDDVSPQDHAHRAGRETVEAVGEIDGVGPGEHQNAEENHKADGTHGEHGDVTNMGQVLASGSDSVVVGELQEQNAEDDRARQLTDSLCRLVQPEIALLADLDEVVEKADDSQ